MYIYGGSTGSAVGDFHELNIVDKTWTLVEMAPGPLPAQHRQQQQKQQQQQQHIRTPNTATTRSSRINSPQPTTAWPPTPGSGNRLIASNFQHSPRQLATDLPAPFPGHVFRTHNTTHNTTSNTRTQPSNSVTSALHTPYINQYLGVDDLNRDINLNPDGEDELPDQPWAPAQWPVSEPAFDPWIPSRATGTTGVNPRGQTGDGTGFDPAIQHLLGVGSQADDDDEPDNNNTYVSTTHTVTNNHTSSAHVVMSASNMVWNNNTNTIPHNYDLPNAHTQVPSHHNHQFNTHHYRTHHNQSHQPHHHQHQQPLSSVSTLCYDNTNNSNNGGVSAGNRFCHVGVVRDIILYTL